MARECFSNIESKGQCFPPNPSFIKPNITQDPEIQDVAPRILDVLSQRLESQYMLIAEADPQDPVLRKIPPLARQARELKAFIG